MPSTTSLQPKPAAFIVRPMRASVSLVCASMLPLFVGGVAEDARHVEAVADLDGAAQDRARLAGRAVGGRRGERPASARSPRSCVISTRYCGAHQRRDHGGAGRRILGEVGAVDVVHLLELRAVGDEDARRSPRARSPCRRPSGSRRRCRARPWSAPPSSPSTTELSLPLRETSPARNSVLPRLDAVAVGIGRLHPARRVDHRALAAGRHGHDRHLDQAGGQRRSRRRWSCAPAGRPSRTCGRPRSSPRSRPRS